jgi:lysozyme
LRPYTDTVGKLTIGYGRNLSDNGITRAEALLLLDHDIDDAMQDLMARYPWTATLDPVRFAVLVEMSFNLGIARLSGFKNTLRAVERGDYDKAADGMLASKWASQVKGRAVTMARQMRSGAW